MGIRASYLLRPRPPSLITGTENGHHRDDVGEALRRAGRHCKQEGRGLHLIPVTILRNGGQRPCQQLLRIERASREGYFPIVQGSPNITN